MCTSVTGLQMDLHACRRVVVSVEYLKLGLCSAEGHIALEALCKATHATCIAVRDLVLAGNVCEVRCHAASQHDLLLCNTSLDQSYCRPISAGGLTDTPVT